MSNLVAHAEEEMRRAGLYEKDADYGGMIPKAVMKLVRAHAEEGHSGGSHWLTTQIFNKVINFKTLTPITDLPGEWMEVSKDMMPSGAKTTCQNRRTPSIFSEDGGKTYHDLDEKPLRFRRLRRMLGLPQFRIYKSAEANP